MRALRRPIALVLLCWYLPACAARGGWKSIPIVPQDAKRTMYVGDVRIETKDGEVHGCRGVWVGPDSLGGWLQEPAGAEVVLGLDQVEAVHVRQPSARHRTGVNDVVRWTLGTVIAVGVGAFVVAGVAFGVYCAFDGCHFGLQ